MPTAFTVNDFIGKWRVAELKERSSAQEHFLDLCRWVMSDPDKLRPGKTRQDLTKDAAAEFATLAQRLRDRGHDPAIVAHFVNRLVFCMFAENSDLLPNKMFGRMLAAAKANPAEFSTWRG